MTTMVDSLAANIINLNTVDIPTWIKDPNNIYIGRASKGLKASKWRNPRKIGHPNSCEDADKLRENAIQFFDNYLQSNKDLANSVYELKDKTLGCWCAPKKCHAEVLHRMAGNKSIYQDLDMNSLSEKEILDQEVKNALQAMNTILDSVGNDVNDSHPPIPVTDIATPSLPTMSTNEINMLYGTILETNSSYNSSSDKDSVLNADPEISHSSPVETREKLEIQQKLKNWRSQQRQCKYPLLTRSLPTSPRRSPTLPIMSGSAPVSPAKMPLELLSSNIVLDTTALDTTVSSSSTFSDRQDDRDLQEVIVEEEEVNDSHKIHNFLADKVDLLSINVNVIQAQLNKITELVKQIQDTFVPRSSQETN